MSRSRAHLLPVFKPALAKRALAKPALSRPVRAYGKIVVVAAALGILLGVVITFVSREAVNELRRHLTLWLILAMAAAINIVTFVLFQAFWALFRWIRRDLEPGEEETGQDGFI